MDRRDAAVGALVAVVERVAEQRAGRVEQAVVDAPTSRSPTLTSRRPPRPRGRRSPRGPRGRAAATSQCSPSGSATGLVGEPVDLVELERRRARPGRRSTRPLDAPRSTARRRRRRHGHRRNAAATPASTGMWRPVVWDRSPPVEREDRGGDVLGQDLALEQRALGVELAELVLGDAVVRGALGAPALGEDARAADDAVGVDAVDPDAVLAELGREQPDLVGLVGLGRAVGDVVRAGEQRVLADDVDDVAADPLVDHDPGRLARDEERAAGHHVVLEVPVVRRSSRAAACEIDRPALLTTRSTPPKASDGRARTPPRPAPRR